MGVFNLKLLPRLPFSISKQKTATKCRKKILGQVFYLSVCYVSISIPSFKSRILFFPLLNPLSAQITLLFFPEFLFVRKFPLLKVICTCTKGERSLKQNKYLILTYQLLLHRDELSTEDPLAIHNNVPYFTETGCRGPEQKTRKICWWSSLRANSSWPRRISMIRLSKSKRVSRRWVSGLSMEMEKTNWVKLVLEMSTFGKLLGSAERKGKMETHVAFLDCHQS